MNTDTFVPNGRKRKIESATFRAAYSRAYGTIRMAIAIMLMSFVRSERILLCFNMCFCAFESSFVQR